MTPTQRVWRRNDIEQIAATLLIMAPNSDFAAGVLALAHAVGARPPVPVSVKRSGPPEALVVEVTL